MTKAQIVDVLSKDIKISKALAGKAIDSIIASVTKALKKVRRSPLLDLEFFSQGKECQ